MNKIKIATIGSVTEDISFYTDKGIVVNKRNKSLDKLLAFKYASKIKVDNVFSSFGGGASNVAVNFSRFGFDVYIFSAIGNDYRGKMILDNLKKNKVNIQNIKKTKLNTGFSVLLICPDSEYIAFVNRASNKILKINNKDIAILKNFNWIYLTSLAGEWFSSLKKIFSLKNQRIAWNPGKAQLEKGLEYILPFLKKTDIFFVNKNEAKFLFTQSKKYGKKNQRFLNNPKNFFKILADCGVKIVVITNGKKGADVYDGKSFYHQDIIKNNKAIDATGVGDAFNSSFLIGLEVFNDIQKAMFLGAKNSSSVISQKGAQNGLLNKSVLKNI